MSLTLKEFQNLSARTAPFKANPQNHIEKQNILTNYTLGLNGEFIEFKLAYVEIDSYETLKEAGDVLHYAVNLLKVLGVKSTDESLGLSKVHKRKAEEAAGMTLEIIKKTYYHGHEFDEKAFVVSVKTVINYLYDILGEINFYKVLEMNIDKLKKRYPEGFSSETSKNRVDVNE